MFRARLTICLVVVPVALLASVAVPAADGTKETPIIVHVDRGGFRWPDAGIGALVGAGLTLATLGCTAVVRSRGAEETSAMKARKS